MTTIGKKTRMITQSPGLFGTKLLARIVKGVMKGTVLIKKGTVKFSVLRVDNLDI